MSDLILETKTFHLSTRSSSCNILNNNKDYKSICEYVIPNMLVRDENIEYTHFFISNAIIPVSFYTVNETNNKLNVLMNDTITSYYFPFGNYNAITFMTEFKTLMGSNFNIELSKYNSVFSVTHSQNDFTFSGSIDAILGFSNSVSSTNKVLVMPRCCNFLSLSRVTIRCPELAQNMMIGSQTSGDVILSVPNNSKPNGQIIYEDNGERNLLKNTELNQFIISITDDDGLAINFNGVSSYFTLQFNIYRKRRIPLPPFHQILAEHGKQRRKKEEEEENIWIKYPRKMIEFAV